jgi:hypothetical protein
MISPEWDELAHVTSLQIYLRVADFDHIERADSIIAHTSALRSLDLELEKPYIYEDDEDCDGAVRILKDMFYTHIKTGQVTRLKSLRITYMCLLLVSELLTTVLELKDLENLQLVRCRDIDPFLRKLEPLGLNLSSLCIVDFGRDHSTDFAVNDFIRSLKPLKRLTLEIDIEYFDQQALQSHHSSLESLHIRDNHRGQPIVPAFKHALKLDQLALFGFEFEDGGLRGEMGSYRSLRSMLVSFRPIQFFSMFRNR